MSSTPPVELTHLSNREVRERLGELVGVSLRQKGACIIVRRRTGEITVLDPEVLDHVPDEEMAAALLSSWSDEEIERYLEEREVRRGHRS
jgi:hypothetical protein